MEADWEGGGGGGGTALEVSTHVLDILSMNPVNIAAREGAATSCACDMYADAIMRPPVPPAAIRDILLPEAAVSIDRFKRAA